MWHQVAALPPPSTETSNVEENIVKEDVSDLRHVFVSDEKKKSELSKENWSSDEIESAFASHESFRITPELRNRVNEVLRKFIGSHYYHNYTSGK